MGRIRSTTGEGKRPGYLIEAEVQQALVNWGRWAAPRFGCTARANVLFVLLKNKEEGHYDNPAPDVPIDSEAAWRAEKVICNPGFVPRWRHLLQAHFAFQTDMRQTCRLLHLHRQEYDVELWKGAYGFWSRYKNA